MKALKSILTLLLLLVFLGTTVGIQVNKHYCGDFLQSISLYVQLNPCADEGGEDACSRDKAPSCCDDETEFHQLKIDVIKQSVLQQDFNLQFSNVIFYTSNFFKLQRETEVVTLLAQPPPISPIPIYKRLKRLTYYG